MCINDITVDEVVQRRQACVCRARVRRPRERDALVSRSACALASRARLRPGGARAVAGAADWRVVAVGASVAAVGEAIRIWAAGHRRKEPRGDAIRSVSLHAPSAVSRARRSSASASRLRRAALSSRCIVADVHLATTIPAAIRAEEAHLREKFGGEYDAYAQRGCAADGARVSAGARARQPRAPHRRRAASWRWRCLRSRSSFRYDRGLPSVDGAVSSVGRAPALHAGCHRFESCTAHSIQGNRA